MNLILIIFLLTLCYIKEKRNSKLLEQTDIKLQQYREKFNLKILEKNKLIQKENIRIREANAKHRELIKNL